MPQKRRTLRLLVFGIPLLVLAPFLAGSATAATINVTTAVDEDNGRTSNLGGEFYPLSQGCSLREALAALFANNGLPNKGCTAATVNGPNTINITVAGPIVVNSPVPNPADITGVGTVRNGTLPQVIAASGSVIISGAAGGASVSCAASPNGVKLFNVQSNGALTLTALTVSNCTAAGGGIAIDSSAGGDVTLNTVTFSNIHSDSGGAGGAIHHGGGNLTVNVANFLNNGTSDAAAPSAETGDGGAIYLSAVSLPDVVNLNTVTFTGNSAANNGGAIFITSNPALGHSITISSGVFTSNTAGGGATNEDGGGAIWAQTGNASTHLFLIGNSQFISNSAPDGNGGAISLSGGQIAYVSATPPAHLLGGVVGSHFQGNSAGGAATANAQGGSGGAIYARGTLSVVQSSFVGNSSTNGSGGAIVLNNGSSSDLGLTVANSTFSGNTADQAGGAIANIHSSGNGAMDLRNVTISGNGANGDTTAGNTAAGGGALYNINNNTNPSFPRVLVANSILASSTVGANCVGAIAGPVFVDNGNNVQFSPNTGCESVPSFDPQLGAPAIQLLAANSVPAINPFVRSMVPANTSPVLNGGNNTICSSGPVANQDQTGVPLRPYGDANCDIGAFEGGTLVPVELQSFTAD